MKEVCIAGAARTPVGSFRGALSGLSAVTLAGLAVEGVLERTGIPTSRVDGLVLGCSLASGLGPAPARAAARKAGLGKSTRALLVSSGAASGAEAVVSAAHTVASGEARVVVAGGMESMSRAPYLLEKARFGYRFGNAELVDSIVRDCLWDVQGNCHLGRYAESVAERYFLERSAQDDYAVESASRAVRAREEGSFEDELVPMTISAGADRFASLNADEAPGEYDPKVIKAAKPIFGEDGTVTTGNSASPADGAAAVVLTDQGSLEGLGARPLAYLRGAECGGAEPGMYPVEAARAVRAVAEKAGLELDRVDLFEVDEDFAITALAITRELGIDPAQVNVNGGATAIGSPVGAGSARVLATLVHTLARRGARWGVQVVASPAGNVAALLVENAR